MAVVDPFASAHTRQPGVGNTADPTGLAAVTRQDLSSQTPVSATLGYAGSYSIALPSGASASSVAQAQQTVTEDQQGLSADQQAESDAATTGEQTVAAAQTGVNAASATLSSDQATLTSDQSKQTRDCAGTGASSPACSQDAQAVSQDNQRVAQDQSQMIQAQQQLVSAKSTATSTLHQSQAKVGADQTKLQGDQAVVASLQPTEINPGTAYTWLPSVGEVIRQDQPVYSLNHAPVLLLYGTVAAYRAFYVGMSDGADVRELTHDLIALGYGSGLARSDHYSTATAAAVKRWQRALGLPATGEILLGQVVFEPGPIRVTSVTPSVGQSVAGGGAGGTSPGAGSSGGSGQSGGGTVLSATSTTRQVSIALDASQQSEVKAGDKVTITLPNNQITPGVIASVGTVATTPASSGSGDSGSATSAPTITVLVKPTDPAATGTWDQAPVNVTITTGTVSNVLVVPVGALLAQPGGGYAVEVAGADGIDHLVTVTLGLFDDADGLVQVNGRGLATGQRVVVPQL